MEADVITYGIGEREFFGLAEENTGTVEQRAAAITRRAELARQLALANSEAEEINEQ